MNISQMIDKVLLEEQEKHKTRERSGKFNPSSFGRCYRAQVLNRANIEKSNAPDIRTLRVFKAGNLFHSFVQNLIPNHRTEVKIETEDFFGFGDLVVDAEETVWDIKSQHSNAFWYMQKSPDIKKDKETNILQVMSYVYFLKYKTGKLCFISKDDLCIAEYSFPIEEWKEKVEKEINTLTSIWAMYKQDNVLPPAEPRCYKNKEGLPQEGKYCSWKDYCTNYEKQFDRISPCEGCKK